MLLKKGDQGEHVKLIQQILGLKVDGDFGPVTEKAVKNYQKENNLTVDGVVGNQTWSSMLKEKEDCYSREEIENAVLSKGYKWFTQDNYDINIVGIRNSSTDGRVTNHYDDHITVSYKVNNNWKFHCWKATTDPGLYWINHPMNKKGCAILVPGQYPGVYKIDKHNGKYKALCQRAGKVRVYRDGDKDDAYDYNADTITEGYYGINIHRSSAYRVSNYINKYSAGCQVFQDPDDFDEFMDICHKAREEWGNKFTYTLIESKDIK